MELFRTHNIPNRCCRWATTISTFSLEVNHGENRRKKISTDQPLSSNNSDLSIQKIEQLIKYLPLSKTDILKGDFEEKIAKYQKRLKEQMYDLDQRSQEGAER